MIIDKLENIGYYVSLHPLFAEAVRFLQSKDWNACETGKIIIKENELFVNIDAAPPKKKEEARLETHDCFIDIQIPLSGLETIGYSPRGKLTAEEAYNKEKDITFYKETADVYWNVEPGMFVIFFPQDAHAPAITPDGVKKIVIKVRIHN